VKHQHVGNTASVQKTWFEIYLRECREQDCCSDFPMKAQEINPPNKEQET